MTEKIVFNQNRALLFKLFFESLVDNFLLMPCPFRCREGLKRSTTVNVIVELATDSRRIVEDRKDLPNSCAGQLERLTGKERKNPFLTKMSSS